MIVLMAGGEEEFMSVTQGTVCLISLSVYVSGVSRLLELSDTVKHLRSQNSEKDASLTTMQISLDRMVGPRHSEVGGGR